MYFLHLSACPQVLEIAFLGIFSIELLLRILVSGPTKFFAYANEDFSWSALLLLLSAFF